MHKNGIPELLAPVGGKSQLDAAIAFGADSVYLACDRFGMRARADNFTLEEAALAIASSHEHGVKVYVTLNTLMDSREIASLPAYIEALAKADADGLIIGDMGAFSVARKVAPEIPLHVSTQASVMNAEAALAWYELGARRIVCAREMSLEEIRLMHERIPDDLQLEAFVHGAMCVAYSGRCLLSAAMTGRSGNKGACAQSCRWRYSLVEEQRPGEFFAIEEDQGGTFILNSQDLCMIEHLDALADAGVDSFKIEGRNKQALYVATVTAAYRSVLDGGDVAEALSELQTISHRPYSTGFYFGEASQSLDKDGYIREYVHVATVEDCVEVGDDQWDVTVSCRNRFAQGDLLTALIPGEGPQDIVVGEIARLAPVDGGGPFVERAPMSLEEVRKLSKPIRETVANRSKEHYILSLPRPLPAGSYLRGAEDFDARR